MEPRLSSNSRPATYLIRGFNRQLASLSLHGHFCKVTAARGPTHVFRRSRIRHALGFEGHVICPHHSLPSMECESSHRQYVTNGGGDVPIALYLWTLKSDSHIIDYDLIFRAGLGLQHN